MSNQRNCREWRIEKYGSLENLMFVDKQRTPVIGNPNELLIRVSAASVNPIDVAMIKGYGSNFLNLARKTECAPEFPLVLGRDFVGEVVFKGMEVKDCEYKIGEKVWGVVPVHKQGTHRDFITVHKSYTSAKPSVLTDLDSSGILYAGLTAWSGIYVTAGIGGVPGATTAAGGGRHKSVLVLGAGGGVGSLAVQMLLSEGVIVSATCSKDAIHLVEKLGVMNVIDYTAPEANENIAQSGPFDLVLDCAGKTSAYAAEIPCSFKQYVTFNSPLLKNVDEHGLLLGNIKNLTDLFASNAVKQQGSSQKGVVKWGYFLPAPHGIEYLKRLVESSKITPVTQAVYPFKEADKSYKRVEDGHLRGKIVISFTESS